MIELIRTNSDNPDFIQLVKLLDAYLAEKDGEEHAFYAQYNKLDKIKHVVIATENGQAIGCGAIKAFGPDVMEVKRMYSAEESRGKGIATKILAELEQWASELGFNKCLLETGRRQPEAISLYQKTGYQQVPNYGQYAGMENSLCFEKELSSSVSDRYQVTFESYNKVADLYQEKFMDLDLYDDTYDRFCALIPQPDAAIFEIGCGPGNITKYLLSRRPDFTIDAIDVAPRMIELAKLNNPTARFNVMDCRELHTLTALYAGTMCGFCLPYLSKSDSEKLLNDAAALLHPGGIIYLSMIEGDYDRSGFEAGSSGDKAYVYYHQEDFMQQTLESCGFQVVDTFRKVYPKGDGISTHLVIIARKEF